MRKKTENKPNNSSPPSAHQSSLGDGSRGSSERFSGSIQRA